MRSGGAKGEVKIYSCPACFSGQGVFNKCLLEFGAEIKQGVGGRKLGEKDLWDPLEVRGKEGCNRYKAGGETRDWIWRSRGRGEEFQSFLSTSNSKTT